MAILRVFALLVVCATAVCGQGNQAIQNTRELTKALRAELRAELVAGLDKETGSPSARIAELEEILIQGLPAGEIEDAQFHSLGPVLLRVDALSESAKARELAKILYQQMKARVEMAGRARQEAEARRLRAAAEALRAAAQTMLKAEKAAELDAPLRMLERLSKDTIEARAGEAAPKEPVRGAESGGVAPPADVETWPGLMDRAGKLYEVMERWQDLLVAVASEKRDPRGPVGDFDSSPGKNTANHLAFRLNNAWKSLDGLLERSAAMERLELLRKLAVPPPPPPFDSVAWHNEVCVLIGKIRDLSEIELAMARIEEITEKRLRETPSPGLIWRMSAPIFQLQAIQKAYKDLEAKVPVPLDRTSSYMALSTDAKELLAPLREKLMRRLAPAALGPTAEPIPENEEIAEYALRQAAKARAERDWRKLGVCYSISWVVYARTKEQGIEAAAVQSLIAAGEFERAGEVSLAVADYLRVVKLGVTPEILEWTTGRLKVLKEKSLPDYERGELLVDAPKRLMEQVIKMYPDALREWRNQVSGPGGYGPSGRGTPIQPRESLPAPAQSKPGGAAKPTLVEEAAPKQ